MKCANQSRLTLLAFRLWSQTVCNSDQTVFFWPPHTVWNARLIAGLIGSYTLKKRILFGMHRFMHDEILYDPV